MTLSLFTLTGTNGQKKEFVAQILEMDDDRQLAQLQFMKRKAYITGPHDISQESLCQILVVLDEPVLCGA